MTYYNVALSAIPKCLVLIPTVELYGDYHLLSRRCSVCLMCVCFVYIQYYRLAVNSELRMAEASEEVIVVEDSEDEKSECKNLIINENILQQFLH